MSDHHHENYDCIVNDHSPAFHHHHGENNIESMDLATALGIPHDAGHSIVGHILGTDACGQQQHFDGHHHFDAHRSVEHYGDTNPAHVNTTDTLVGLNWAMVLGGLKFSRNILFVGIFCLMFLWLGALHWIRQNETQVNETLGMGTGAAPAQVTPSNLDQALLNGTRNAMPVPTSMLAARQATLGTTNTATNTKPNTNPPCYVQIPMSGVVSAPSVVTPTYTQVRQEPRETFAQVRSTAATYYGQQNSSLIAIRGDKGAVRLKTIVNK